MPPGGPEDKKPPEVIPETLIPPNGATRVPLDTEVIIEFNEKVEHQTVADAFFISPYPKGGFEFKWKGRRLVIRFPEKLDADRTYVLTIGTDTQDLRRNRMRESFTFAFSTGDSIDQAEITGVVQASVPVKGAQIWAYPLTDSLAPNPQRLEASYITQADENGDYRLRYLSPHPYRLFTVVDKDVNRIYDPEYDLLGICTKDALLDHNNLLVSHCNFQLTTQDTTRPGLFRVYVTDNRHLALRFDEPISSQNTDSLSQLLIQQIENEKIIDTLRLQLMYQNPQDPSRLELITATPMNAGQYLVTAQDFYDLAHNPLEPAYRTIEFAGNATPDTLPPQIVSVVPADSARQVPLDQTVEFYFSEAMNDSSLSPHIIFIDTTGNLASGKFIHPKPNYLKFIPDANWTSLMSYTIRIKADSIFDWFDNALAESTLTYLFTTLNADTLASISGNIIDEFEADSGRIYLTARQTKKDGKFYETVIKAPGPYLFDGVFPGDYLISGFRDRDGNGTYSYGNISPFIPAERFFTGSDTIRVRSRWPNEGNDITIPR